MFKNQAVYEYVDLHIYKLIYFILQKIEQIYSTSHNRNI